MNHVHRRTDDISKRQKWMSLLARADAGALQSAWDAYDKKPQFHNLRGPETGMVMVRARAGGEGQQFNFGEMTLTRCVVQLDDGTQGHSYIAGRNKTHAAIAAVLDALLQNSDLYTPLTQKFIDPIEKQLAENHAVVASKVAATRVDFFTMVRGED